jgi:hypothetical protein
MSKMISFHFKKLQNQKFVFSKGNDSYHQKEGKTLQNQKTNTGQKLISFSR